MTVLDKMHSDLAILGVISLSAPAGDFRWSQHDGIAVLEDRAMLSTG